SRSVYVASVNYDTDRIGIMLDPTSVQRHDGRTYQRPGTQGSMSVQPQDNTQWEQALTYIAVDRDKQAYSQLFSYFAPRLQAFGLKMFGNEQQAMEMVLRRMLKLSHRTRLVDARRGWPPTWICRIAPSAGLEILRKNQNRK